MIQRGVFTSIVVLSMAGCIKAGTLGFKLLIMAAAGLAGMYMVHLLAQDYNKYQSLHRSVRSIHDTTGRPVFVSEFGLQNSTEKSILRSINTAEQHHFKFNELLTLDRILQFDPTGCARRYVCTISAKSSKKRSQYEKNIIDMLRSRSSAKGKPHPGQEAFNHALNLGRTTKDAAACAEEYPKCLFSISQMLKLMGIS